jgi:hypothetical protein
MHGDHFLRPATPGGIEATEIDRRHLSRERMQTVISLSR